MPSLISITRTGARRAKPAQTRPTARTADPLEDLREIAEAPGLEWATRLWVRFRPRLAALLDLARRQDLSATAFDVASALYANPVWDAKEARWLKQALFSLLGAIATQEPARPARPPRPGPRPGRGGGPGPDLSGGDVSACNWPRWPRPPEVGR
jgi:hypothetical protein